MTPNIPDAVIDALKAYEANLGIKIVLTYLVGGSKREDDRGLQWSISANGVEAPAWRAALTSSKLYVNFADYGNTPRDAILGAVRMAALRQSGAALVAFERAMLAAWPEP